MGDSLGEYFQRAREAKGLTVEEAAARTRILPQFLKAVEENNYARLPDEVFAKGFVRSYARILGLDEAAVIRKFDESGGQFYAKRAERETLRQQLEADERRKKVNRNTVVGVVGVALLLLFVLIGRDRDRSELGAKSSGKSSSRPDAGCRADAHGTVHEAAHRAGGADSAGPLRRHARGGTGVGIRMGADRRAQWDIDEHPLCRDSRLSPMFRGRTCGLVNSRSKLGAAHGHPAGPSPSL